MARAGLGANWECAFANDFCAMKAGVYRANWDEDIVCADINSIHESKIPTNVDLAWASFPCQDLSLAGNALGIGTEQEQTRSGAFWAFWRLMQRQSFGGMAPRLIVLENVYGSLTANDGRDFAAICRALSLENYRLGGVVIDAIRFVPQSRPRVFLIGVRGDLAIPCALVASDRDAGWHPAAMEAAVDRLGEADRANWFWLRVPEPKPMQTRLADLIESIPYPGSWHSAEETRRLIGMMSAPSLARLDAMRRRGRSSVGTIYKRTRADEFGNRRQRAELRDDGIAGCLRTPGGGSSRQTVIVVDGDIIKTRLLSAREAARLMGLPDTYQLPNRYNDAYHVAGDGVVVPVVRHLAATVLEPILLANSAQQRLAA